MKRIIVGSLEVVSLILFVLVLLASAAVGYQEARIPGAIVASTVAFISGILMFGTLFILLEINESLREIRKSLKPRTFDANPSLRVSTLSTP